MQVGKQFFDLLGGFLLYQFPEHVQVNVFSVHPSC
jgi:hypothetical protein